MTLTGDAEEDLEAGALDAVGQLLAFSGAVVPDFLDPVFYGSGFEPGFYGPGLCRRNPGACAVGAFTSALGTAFALSDDGYYI